MSSFQCTQCGGHVVFDISAQQCRCEHCGSLFSPGDYREDRTSADEHTAYGAVVYTCSQCGAELISMDQETVGYCSYCGAGGILGSRMRAEKRPARIIPFKITREDCKKEYAALIKKAPYAPKEFRDPAYLDRLRGIYIPYWMYTVDFVPNVALTADRSYTSGSYSYQEVRRVTVDLNGVYRGIPYDASSAFDDSVTENIAPYHQKEIVPFAPGYLAGFFADSADVDDALYRDDAVSRAARNVLQEIAELYEKKKLMIRMPAAGEARTLLQAHCTGAESTLFPVWFLTWRKKDRVAYLIMNGETGKIAADLPVDIGRFLLGSAAAAGILFLAMSLFVSMTAPTALFLSSVLAAASSGLFLAETRAIHDRENHIFDRGFFIRGDAAGITPEKAEEIRHVRLKKAEKKAVGTGKRTWTDKLISHITTIAILVAAFFTPIMACVAVLFGAIADIPPAGRAAAGCLFTAVLGVICFVRLLPLLPRVRKTTLLQALPAFLAELTAFLIAFQKPVQDRFYYIGCIFCLIGILVTCLSLITRYNLLATRPVPQFFSREKGGDRHA